MLWTRFDEGTMRRVHQYLAESDAFGKTAWPDKNLWVRHNPDDTAQDLPRNAVT